MIMKEALCSLVCRGNCVECYWALLPLICNKLELLIGKDLILGRNSILFC